MALEFICGAVIGGGIIYLYFRFLHKNNISIDTDKAVGYLKKQGYWVSINAGPKQEE